MCQPITPSFRAAATTATLRFFFSAQAAEEVAQRTGVFVEVLGGLDQHPTGLAVASLGDRTVVTVCRPIAWWKAPGPGSWSPCRRRGNRVGSPQAASSASAVATSTPGKVISSFTGIAGVTPPGQLGVQHVDLLPQEFQLPQVGVHQQTACGVEFHRWSATPDRRR